MTEVVGMDIEAPHVYFLVRENGEENVIPGLLRRNEAWSQPPEIEFPSEPTEMTWDQAQEIQDFLDRQSFRWLCCGVRIQERPGDDVKYDTVSEEAGEPTGWGDIGGRIPLVFDEEIKEIIRTPHPFPKFPIYTRAEDGTWFRWKSVSEEEEVELVLDE